MAPHQLQPSQKVFQKQCSTHQTTNYQKKDTSSPIHLISHTVTVRSSTKTQNDNLYILHTEIHPMPQISGGIHSIRLLDPSPTTSSSPTSTIWSTIPNSPVALNNYSYPWQPTTLLPYTPQLTHFLLQPITPAMLQRLIHYTSSLHILHLPSTQLEPITVSDLQMVISSDSPINHRIIKQTTHLICLKTDAYYLETASLCIIPNGNSY